MQTEVIEKVEPEKISYWILGSLANALNPQTTQELSKVYLDFHKNLK